MPTPTVKVLLVEDSPSDAALLRESLEQCGFESFTFAHAETLAEAIALLRREPFDLLLLDLSLPDSTGADTFRRARVAAPHLPIVLLTSFEDELIGLEAVRHGIQDYLVKGQAYGRQTSRAIRFAIERKRSEEALKEAEVALQRERNLLEVRVRERTAELSDANRALQAEMSKRQQAQEAHRLVLRRLFEAQETERGRISRELHDRLGQDMTALKLGLQLLRKHGPFSPPAQETVGRLDKLIRDLMRDVHRLAWELRPSALDDLGLELALQRYITEWSETAIVPVDFHSDGLDGDRLPLEIESTLYRVALEALTNIVRHARARRVSVLLERRGPGVSLIVEDDGLGFDVDAVLASPSGQDKLGIIGMEERLTLVGGSLEIESSPGSGTTLFARLPLSDSSSPNLAVNPPHRVRRESLMKKSNATTDGLR